MVEKAIFPKRERDLVKDLSSLDSPFKGLILVVSSDWTKANDPIEKIYRDKETLIIKKMGVKG